MLSSLRHSIPRPTSRTAAMIAHDGGAPSSPPRADETPARTARHVNEPTASDRTGASSHAGATDRVEWTPDRGSSKRHETTSGAAAAAAAAVAAAAAAGDDTIDDLIAGHHASRIKDPKGEHKISQSSG